MRSVLLFVRIATYAVAALNLFNLLQWISNRRGSRKAQKATS